MGKLTLYGFDPSPPVRAVKLTLAALQLEYNYVVVNVVELEQFSKEYLKKNPQHSIPMLEDGETCIWDSHAIMCYLVSKYAKDDSLYPKDLVERALVDQRLHFESGVVFGNALRPITIMVLFMGLKVVPKERIVAIIEVYKFMEAFLKDYNYMAGNQLTIADFSLISSITSLVAYVPIDVKYAKLSAWIKRMEQLPYYEINAKGAKILVDELKEKMFKLETNAAKL